MKMKQPVSPGLQRQVQAAGFSVAEFTFPDGYAMEPHDHADDVIVLMFRGSYRGRVGTNEYSIESGDWLLAPANRNHQGLVGPDGSRAILIEPSPDRTGQIRRLGGTGIRRASGLAPRRLASRLSHEMRATDSAAPIALEAAVLDIVAAFVRRTNRLHEVGRVPVRRARDMVEGSLGNPPRLQELACALGVSPSRLHRAFKLAFGCSVAAYVRARRIERAEEMIRTTDLPLTQVAHELGFYDQSHLTNAFRAYHGVTPRSLRLDTGV